MKINRLKLITGALIVGTLVAMPTGTATALSKSEISPLVDRSISWVEPTRSGDVDVTSTRSDYSAQTILTIKSAQAPHEYRFPLHLPSGAVPMLNEDGSVTVIDAAGKYLGTFLPPWARDANGVEVPTQYHLSGNILSQVVEFSDSTAFPVIADPKWLDDLWNGTKMVVGKVVQGAKCAGSLILAGAPPVKAWMFIKSLGKAREAIATFRGAGKSSEYGNAVLGTASSILGLDSIKKNCVDSW